MIAWWWIPILCFIGMVVGVFIPFVIIGMASRYVPNNIKREMEDIRTEDIS